MKKGRKIIATLVIIIATMVTISALYITLRGAKHNSSKNIVTIQFDSLGGTEIELQKIEAGEVITEPETPSKEGFTFVEWQLDGEAYDFSKAPKDSITLIAKWQEDAEEKNYTVTFNSDGGTKVDSIKVKEGNSITKPAEPTRKGYVFKGWYLGEKKYDFKSEIENDIVLNAKWSKKETASNTNGDNVNNTTINNDNTDSNTTSNSDKPDNQANNTANSGDKVNMDNKVEGSKEEYEYIKNDIKNYGNKTPEWQFGYKENMKLDSTFGFQSYDREKCKIAYRTDNSNVLKVDSNGVATGTGLGKTKLHICLVDKVTNKEIDYFTWIANVKYQVGSAAATKDTANLLNGIDGHYWYLDGYNYAYIKGDVIPWYDHKALSWTSQHIELENNAFVTSEQTGKNYWVESAAIHNKFLANPAEMAYMLIEEYNMRVSSNKLYITFGGKTYSFTRHTSKKKIYGKISLNQSEISVNKYEPAEAIVKISPSFAEYDIEVSSSNTNNVDCWINNNHNGTVTISCIGNSVGTAVITVRDKISGDSKTFTVVVKNNIIGATGVSLNKSDTSIYEGETETLYATIIPENATNKKVFWQSSDVNIASVDSKGKVKAYRPGTATITAMTEDGSYTASCKVEVKMEPLTLDGSIGISTRVSDSGVSSGMIVEAKPSGGTKSYTYNIKLYYEGNLIGEGTQKELFVNQTTNGTYSATITVTDSSGNTKTIVETITKN